MKLIDKNKLLEELKKLKQNLSASPIVVIEDVESLVESLDVKEVEEVSVSNDLEEAADNYVGHAPEIDEDLSCFIRRNAFIAGAQWQKEQLMENAVEAVIHPYDGEIWVDKDLLSVYNDYQHVKLIIIEGEHFFELGLKK